MLRNKMMELRKEGLELSMLLTKKRKNKDRGNTEDEK